MMSKLKPITTLSLMTMLIGDQKEQSLQLKTKDLVDHAGHSQPPETLKDYHS